MVMGLAGRPIGADDFDCRIDLRHDSGMAVV
jgi:hypothetical protein